VFRRVLFRSTTGPRPPAAAPPAPPATRHARDSPPAGPGPTGPGPARRPARPSGDRLVQHVRDQLRHLGPLGALQRDVREQLLLLEGLDHRGDAVVAADAEVVALGDVVGKNHAGVLAE